MITSAYSRTTICAKLFAPAMTQVATSSLILVSRRFLSCVLSKSPMQRVGPGCAQPCVGFAVPSRFASTRIWGSRCVASGMGAVEGELPISPRDSKHAWCIDRQLINDVPFQLFACRGRKGGYVAIRSARACRTSRLCLVL